MKQIVSTGEGWRGIENALARAETGTTIELQPGMYEGASTLFMPSGVTLSGDNSVLNFVGDGPVVVAQDVEDVVIEGLTIDASAATITLRRRPDAEAYDPSAEQTPVVWGLLWLNTAANISVSDVSIKGCGAAINGVFATACQNTNLKRVNVENSRTGIILQRCEGGRLANNRCHDNAQSGIILFSSESAGIDGNECWGNGASGIVLVRDEESPNAPSQAPITGNRCHDNAQVGIILFSSESAGIDGNECWGNGANGIVLVRDEKSLDAPSQAPLTDNRCHDNAETGIILFSSESAGIDGNECWGNGGSGIVLVRDPESPDAPSQAPLTGNRCHDNAQAGIILFSSESAGIDGNECWGNGASGIVLGRGDKSLDAPSQAPLTGNRCHDNAQSGIILFSSESAGIDGNECWGNGVSGIVLQRDPESPDAPSQAPLTGNRCHDSAETGIILFSSESAGIDGNECWGNGKSGIALVRDEESPDAPSQAPLTGNRCHDNAETGIVLFSSESAGIDGNECWGNGVSGIALVRDEESPDAPSQAPLTGNRCHDNAETGIVLFSSESAGIDGNECWGNGVSGIVLGRSSESPDAPSQAPLTGNRCHDNARAGIILFSSESAGIDGNECWANGGSGIVLGRGDKSLDAPSQAPLTGNRCHDNAQSGIILFSSESAGIDGNECWGNGVSGIVLQRDPESPDAPSQAPLTGNRCHDSAETGIILFSSESAGIDGNECWGNGKSGIALVRDEESPDAPSQAPLTGNRCHDNARAGIILFSSESAGIDGNECWGNGGSGIVLVRDEESPDAPSQAPITGNRCHDNAEAGFSIDDGSEGKIKDNNIAFRNAHASARIDPNGRVIRDISSSFSTPDETPFQTKTRKRSEAESGRLATQLEHAVSFNDPDAFARFLYGHGSLYDLKQSLALVVEPPSDDTTDQTPGDAVYELAQTDTVGIGDNGVYRFHRGSSSGLRRLIWDRVAKHVVADQPATTTVIGAFGDAGKDIKSIVDDALNANGFDVDALAAGKDVPTGRRDLLRALQVGSVRIVPPLVYDCLERSDLAQLGEAIKTPFLEPEPLTGWRAWLTRTVFVLGTPAYLATLLGLFVVSVLGAAAVGAAKRYPGPFADPITMALEAISANIADIQLLDVVLVVIALAAGTFFAGIVIFANRFLPWHLQIRPKRMPDGGQTSQTLRGRAWKRWISRRILPRQSVSLVILRNVLEWPDHDRAALNDLIDMRPDGASLIVIIECPTRTALDRALLAVLSKPDGTPARETATVDVFACLGAEPGFIQAAEVPQNSAQKRILGIVGEKSDVRLEQIRSDILSAEALPGDLLPMICLGSSHYFPFSVQRRSTTAATTYSKEMQETLSRYLSLMEASRAGDAEWLGESAPLRMWVEEAREASCARLFLESRKRLESYRVFGRFQVRNAMAAMIADVFKEDQSGGEDYTRGMLRCGELHSVLAAQQALAIEIETITHPNRALAAMKGALFLRDEHDARAGITSDRDTRRSEIIATAWRDLCSTIDRLPATSDPNEMMLQAQLYAASLHVRDPIPDVLAPPDTVQGGAARLQAVLQRAKSRFKNTDRKLALDCAMSDLRPLLALSPEQIQGVIEKHLRRASYDATSLASLLEAAETQKDLLGICERHAMAPDQLLATVVSNAVRLADTDDRRIDLASKLYAHPQGLHALQQTDHPRGYNREGDANFENYLQLLSSETFSNVIEGDRSGQAKFGMIELMYGSTSHLFGTGPKTDRIEFWESSTASISFSF